MSSVSGVNGTYTTQQTSQTTAKKRDIQDQEPEHLVTAAEMQDTVEISDTARKMLHASKEVMAPGSAELQEFKDLMSRVKTQKTDIMSDVKAALEKAGVKVDMGKLKIEVDSAGKIIVGGLKDKKALRAVERELNAHEGLGKRIKEYQRDEQKLSEQVKEYTGFSLYELSQASKGDPNQRTRDLTSPDNQENEEEYYARLGFIDASLSPINLDDVVSLRFDSIDFSAEASYMADAESNIKESLSNMAKEVEQAFIAKNDELKAHMEKAGGKIDAEFMATYFMDMKGVTITVNNNGGLEIDGMFAKDERTNQKALEIVEKLYREILRDPDDNSYHVNQFQASSEYLIGKKAEEAGFEDGLEYDAVVEAKIVGGLVTDVGVRSAASETKLEGEILSTVNSIFKDRGVELPDGVNIEVDDSGKLVATNLDAESPMADRINEILEELNGEIGKAKPKEDDKADTEKTPAGQSDWHKKAEEVAGLVARLQTLRAG